ncbi:MAG TPA: TIGR00730 family Rossman fold protein [Candidatus Saccharimonadales bacterium]|nr:TIGR00730 family Rossman fold protein [Candidatus Saccharimonadales bacterium]
MNVGVFCSAYDLDDKYTKPAQEFATLLAQAGHTMVWGGSDVGLMGIMAGGVKAGGGKLVGVSIELFKDLVRKDADEMIVAKNLGERKAILLQRSDALVMMVGGIGTLDEATEVLELKKHGHHDKPIIMLNTAGFYNGFKQQLHAMDREGFLPKPLAELMLFVDTPEEAIKALGPSAIPDIPVMEIPEPAQRQAAKIIA